MTTVPTMVGAGAILVSEPNRVKVHSAGVCSRIACLHFMFLRRNPYTSWADGDVTVDEKLTFSSALYLGESGTEFLVLSFW